MRTALGRRPASDAMQPIIEGPTGRSLGLRGSMTVPLPLVTEAMVARGTGKTMARRRAEGTFGIPSRNFGPGLPGRRPIRLISKMAAKFRPRSDGLRPVRRPARITARSIWESLGGGAGKPAPARRLSPGPPRGRGPRRPTFACVIEDSRRGRSRPREAAGMIVWVWRAHGRMEPPRPGSPPGCHPHSIDALTCRFCFA